MIIQEQRSPSWPAHWRIGVDQASTRRTGLLERLNSYFHLLRKSPTHGCILSYPPHDYQCLCTSNWWIPYPSGVHIIISSKLTQPFLFMHICSFCPYLRSTGQRKVLWSWRGSRLSFNHFHLSLLPIFESQALRGKTWSTPIHFDICTKAIAFERGIGDMEHKTRQLLGSGTSETEVERVPSDYHPQRAIKAGGDSRFDEIKHNPLKFTSFWMAQGGDKLFCSISNS